MSEMSPDMAAKVAALKKKMAETAASGGGDAAKSEAAEKPADGGDAAATSEASSGGDDMASKVAALKAKMEAGKGKPAETPTAAKAPSKPAPKKKSSAKQVFPVQPIDRTSFGEEDLYRPGTLNRWFALGGLVLTIAVIGMLVFDYQRDWKHFQEQKREIDLYMLETAFNEADAQIDDAALERLVAAEAAAEAAIAAQQERIEEARETLADLEAVAYKTNQDYQILKSIFDAERYAFEEMRLSHGDDSERLDESRAEILELEAEMLAAKDEADIAAEELTAAKASLDAIFAAQVELERERDALTAERDRIGRSLARIERNPFNDYIRNAPIVDMLAPTLKVEKIVLDKLYDNYNFQYVRKVDMCITCHVSIADSNFEDFGRGERPDDWAMVEEDGSETPLPWNPVFMAHPRLDLFVSDTSPHPMAEFGCTICHQGRGQATEFPRTFHTPADEVAADGSIVETREEKRQRWVEEYDYDPDRHYWDWPMLPKDKLYASCYQCHDETDRIPGAPIYNEARALVEDKGCYGCHKIDGLQHLRKPGPDLSHLAAKTDLGWIRKWLMSPQGFRPTTNMPHFWNQSNSGGSTENGEVRFDTDVPWHNNSDAYVDDWRERNEVEARAVAAYIWDQSRDRIGENGYTPATPPASPGDAERGRWLFENRGCLGCHALEAEDQVANDHGPDLSGIGSKVRSEWLFDWVLNPTKYWPETVMPDLRLTPEEAWDITTYLMGYRNDEFEATAEPDADEALLDEIALEHLTGLRSTAAARADLERMKAEGGVGAVELFAGQRLLQRYGCAGCHMIPGHENDQGIGTELTRENLKELSKFDFGFEYAYDNPRRIEHTKEAWYRNKLKDPRIYDRVPVIGEADGDHVVLAYEQKKKTPNDKLKMPNYYLDEREVELLTMFIMGMTGGDGIDPTMMRTLDDDERVVEHGSRLITERNCIGCHRMGQLPTTVDVTMDNEDLIDEGLDYGLWLAEAVEMNGEQILAAHEWLTDELYDPWEEWDAYIFDFMEENGEIGEVAVYGKGEGAMGEYIDEAAMRPPVLRGEGAKVRAPWLYEFLLAPYTVRTHVNVRMPSFGLSKDESLALTRWFAARDDQLWPFELDEDTEPDLELLAQGKRIYESLRCYQCHPGGEIAPTNAPEDWGPNLSLAAERLKSDWVHDWLKDPQALQPGTKMPTFFGEEVDGEYEAYVDDWAEQIRALQHYLRHLELASGPEFASND